MANSTPSVVGGTAGSIPAHLAYSEGETRPLRDDGSVPWFSQGVHADTERTLKHCVGNNHTCKGFRSNGTEWCVGHQKGKALPPVEVAGE